MNTQKCDGCQGLLIEPIYKPLNSTRGALVYKCSDCGLVQTLYLTPKDDTKKAKTISTDADWGNVRHGKGIRYVDAKSYLIPILEQKRPEAVLDIGSNRADFLKDIFRYDYIMKITAVEPDISLSSEYAGLEDSGKLELKWQRFEDCLFSMKYDFIYSCQTLEHASSARKMLAKSYDLLKDDGFMYIEVPSINIIADERGVEEFFIDKHAYHFSLRSLTSLAAECGFRIVRDFDSDIFNIKLLFAKSSPCKMQGFVDEANIDILFQKYPRILEKNRSLLKTLVEDRLRPLALRQKVAYWGANRIFDSLVKYGGLNKDDIFMLVDTHMCGKLESSAGIAIEHPDYIRVKEPQVCVVLARSSEEQIARLAYDMGVRHILKYTELYDQVADPASNE